MVFSCDFDANPQGVVSGKSVRFYPRVTDAASPITNYHWDFGDGSAHVDGPNPTHTFPTVATLTSYDVTLTVTDSNSNTTFVTKEDFIWSDAEANIPDPVLDDNIAVFIWDDTNSMIARRKIVGDSHFILLNPRTTDRIDIIGTATFSLIDLGSSTIQERSLVAEGKSIAIINNNAIVFSGLIRRATQDTQAGFGAVSSRIKQWSIECDSDLARHSNLPIVAASMVAGGKPYYDSLGNIARAILAPDGVNDIRGVIDCTDAKVVYQLNSADAEDAGSQYEHLMTLKDVSNYDLRSRPYGQMHLGADFVWGNYPINGNFQMEDIDANLHGWVIYAESGTDYDPPQTYARVESVPAYGTNGTRGGRFSIHIDDPDTSYFYGYSNVEQYPVAPSGFTGISFDYRILSITEQPDVVDPDGSWETTYAAFYLNNDDGSVAWYAPDLTPGTWRHVELTGTTFTKCDFALEVSWDDGEPIPGKVYNFVVVLDNVHLTGYSPEKYWAALRLEGGPMWEYRAYAQDSGCVIPGTDTLYYIVQEDTSWSIARQLWKSTNGGETWALVTNALPFGVAWYGRLFGLRDGSLVVIDYDILGEGNFQNAIWRSTDGGLHWTLQSVNVGGLDSIAEDASGNLYMAKTDGFYRSTNKGVTWVRVCESPGWASAEQREFFCLANGNIIGIGWQSYSNSPSGSGDVWSSSNGGVDWTLIGNITGAAIWYEACGVCQQTDGNVFCYIDGVLRKSTDNGATWSTATTKGSGVGGTLVVLSDGNTLVAYGGYNPTQGNAVWKSVNDSSTWTLVNSDYENDTLVGNTILFDVGVTATVTHNNHYFALADSVSADIVDVPADGMVISPAGYRIDFARDLSQPEPVKNLDVNKDCFEFNDNDDKAKLATKVIARAKDYSGKSISVMIAGVHEYDAEHLFFEDSTFVTQKSEGYVYKNNYADPIEPKSVGVWTPVTGLAATNGVEDDAFYINYAGAGHFAHGSLVTSSSNNPPTEVPNGDYYCYLMQSDYDRVYLMVNRTDTTHIDPIGTLNGDHTLSPKDGGFIIDNSDNYLAKDMRFTVTADTLPTGVSENTTYYVLDEVGNSTEEAFRFSTSEGGSAVDLTDGQAGSNVSITKLDNVSGGGIPSNDPTVWLYGWGYVIPSGSTVAMSKPGVSATAYTTDGAPTEGIDYGVPYTEIKLTSWMTDDYASGKGFCLNKRIYVDDASRVGTNEVLIGEEKITVSATGTDTTYGPYIEFADVTDRVSSSTLKCYPHDVGGLVARTNYTLASPDANSPITLYGVSILDITVDGNVTYGQLDAYATSLLLGLGNFYKKATCWVPLHKAWVKRVTTDSDFPSYSTPISVGDRISITEYSGATPEEFQVVSVKTVYDEGRMFLELGDYEKNPYSSLEQKTNALNRTLT